MSYTDAELGQIALEILATAAERINALEEGIRDFLGVSLTKDIDSSLDAHDRAIDALADLVKEER